MTSRPGISLLALGGLLLLASPVEAQKNCKKGIPCGNTCIAANKVCRVGTPSRAPAAQPLNSAAPIVARYVGSKADKVYFLATCLAAQDLAPANRREFATVEDAEKAGFRRSRVEGC